MTISNSEGSHNPRVKPWPLFCADLRRRDKRLLRVQRTGLVLLRSEIGLENDVRWRDLWSADGPVCVACAGRFNACGISIYSTPVVGDLVDMFGCCCLRKSRRCSGVDASAERASKSSALGLPSSPRLQRGKRPRSSLRITLRRAKGNQLRFGPACAGKNRK